MPRSIKISTAGSRPRGDGPTNKGIHPNSEVVIDVDRLEEILQNLRANHNLLIKELKGEILEDFKAMMQAVSAAHGTEAYGVILDLARKHFNDLSDEACEMGSIQGYFNGCVMRTNLSGNPSCTPLCAGSLPPHPDLPGWEDCQYLVVNYTPDAHTFSVLNSASDKSKAVIYMPEKADFKGFSTDELKKLSDFGIKEVKLIKYTNSSHYIEESSGFVALSTTSAQQTDSSSSSSSSAAVGWGILIIVVIVILGLIALFAGAGIYSQGPYDE